MKTTETMADLLNFIDETNNVSNQELDEEARQLNGGAPILANRDEANNYIRKYKELEAEIQSIQATAQEAVDQYTQKVEMWEQNQLQQIKRRLQFCKFALEQYTQNNLTDGKKSLRLIEGTIGFRKQPPALVYDDEEEVINYLKQTRPDLIKEKLALDKNNLKKDGQIVDDTFMLDGKPIPGVSVEQKDKQFVVK